MNLKKFFVIHAVLTFAAGIVLFIEPAAIPSAVEIDLPRSAYLICYLLASCEIALAFLSFMARKIDHIYSLKIIVTTFIIFHGLTAAGEIIAFSQNVSPQVLQNVAVRLLVIFLFLVFYRRESRAAKAI